MNVTVYSTPTCPWCTIAKDYLKNHNIEFTNVDVNSDSHGAMEMIKKSGQRGVPVLDIGGKIIVGFDEPAIEEALKS